MEHVLQKSPNNRSSSLMKITDEGDYSVMVDEQGRRQMFTYIVELFTGEPIIINETIKKRLDEAMTDSNQKFIQIKETTIAVSNIAEIRKRWI